MTTTLGLINNLYFPSATSIILNLDPSDDVYSITFLSANRNRFHGSVVSWYVMDDAKMHAEMATTKG